MQQQPHKYENKGLHIFLNASGFYVTDGIRYFTIRHIFETPLTS